MAKTNKTIATLPLIPLRGVMVFPHMVLHFDVGRGKSIAALEHAMNENQKIFLVTQKNSDVEEPTLNDLYSVGVIASVKQVLNVPGDLLRVLVEGDQRAKLINMQDEGEYRSAEIEVTKAPLKRTSEEEVLRKTMVEVFEEYSKISGRVAGETVQTVMQMDDSVHAADLISANVLTRFEDRIEVLEAIELATRFELISRIIMREIELAKVEKRVQFRLKKQIDKNQKDYYLREQLKAIHEELGDKEANDVDKLREKAELLPLSEIAREKVLKELDRISTMASGSPELNTSRTYVETILDLPWEQFTEDNLDLKRARSILDKNHFAMEKVKERIIEYLAVRKMKEKNTKNASLAGPILCFVGPPGVGKTSIVQGIAAAVGRKFVQMSLGGVRDEAEIRGHRRTYIGAIPGRIIANIKQANSMNPVFLFDEIDKMGSDYKGDPASAMLEVLDGEHNATFQDHYLEIPFDLSKVMFITTANNKDTIPGPLLDRMEIIEVPSYTEEEKLQIAKKHLVKKQVKEHGLPNGSVKISDSVLRATIEGYTREAGVRTLSRTIASIVRKVAVSMLEDDVEKVTVTKALLRDYLGAERYLREMPEKQALVGIVNGLAYTSVGGEMLSVECSVLPGTGKLELTGKLGDVMKESARAALSWVRSKASIFNIEPTFHKEYDIHIHVPEGAVPKDGPSAGVTITTALVSALTNRTVKQDVAMTGEITLRGRVLPIGGLKEKLMAAYRAKIKTVIIPKENVKDLEDIPVHVMSMFRIISVSDVEEVIDATLNERE